MFGESNSMVQVALRNGNKKRRELLVNSLQAKHIPTEPSAALNMMASLAKLLEKPDLGRTIVVGFAETATAIGLVAAEALGSNCLYVHTTRESTLAPGPKVAFLEEHSHATRHSLCTPLLKQELHQADSIIFIDDEFTTGRTLANAVSTVCQLGDFRQDGRLFAVSVINRMNSERPLLCGGREVVVASILNDIALPSLSMENTVPPFEYSDRNKMNYRLLVVDEKFRPHNPRVGVYGSEYLDTCLELGGWISLTLRTDCEQASSVAVIGTEECMLPSIVAGKVLSETYSHLSVRCHATTRSPITISTDEGYPITNGCTLRSVYDKDRKTYLYNLQHYDLVIVVTDANLRGSDEGFRDLSAAFSSFGAQNMVAVVI